MNCFKCKTDNNLMYIGESNGLSLYICDHCQRREGFDMNTYPTTIRNGGSSYRPQPNSPNQYSIGIVSGPTVDYNVYSRPSGYSNYKMTGTMGEWIFLGCVILFFIWGKGLL